MAELKEFTSVAAFFFKTPLYTRLALGDALVGAEAIFRDDINIDGHCPFCKRQSTFTRSAGYLQDHYWANIRKGSTDYSEVLLVCARQESHVLRFILRTSNKIIQKVGQFPSFADIALDESKQYTGTMDVEDSRELHKAIGLAAHGVGIGSFVYMRRIFERLIWKRFNEFKDAEGWSERSFGGCA